MDQATATRDWFDTMVVASQTPSDFDGEARVIPLNEFESDMSLPNVLPIPTGNVDLELFGHWKGSLSMGDHAHPISFDIARSDAGAIRVNSNFAPYNKQNTFGYADGYVRILLGDAGVLFDGQLVGTDQLVGSVDWMGRKQALEFAKDRPAKPKRPARADQPEKAKADHSTMGQRHGEMLNVAILVFDGVDTLDWAGPLEVFSSAHSFKTYTVAPSKKPIRGDGHRLFADYTFADMPAPDIVVVPGGDIAHVFHKPEIMSWIGSAAAKADITMSVCNASLLFARASLLDDARATTHSAWMSWLTDMSAEQNFTVTNGPRFVDNGKIVTTAGVSSGIDGALHVVARLRGLRVARMAARNMEYDWRPASTNGYRR